MCTALYSLHHLVTARPPCCYATTGGLGGYRVAQCDRHYRPVDPRGIFDAKVSGRRDTMQPPRATQNESGIPVLKRSSASCCSTQTSHSKNSDVTASFAVLRSKMVLAFEHFCTPANRALEVITNNSPPQRHVNRVILSVEQLCTNTASVQDIIKVLKKHWKRCFYCSGAWITFFRSCSIS